MKSLTEYLNKKLIWSQPKIFKKEFILNSFSAQLAKLNFTSMFKYSAVAESSTGKWMFDKQGVFKPKYILKNLKSDIDLGSFTYKKMNHGLLILPDGTELRIKNNIWVTQYEILNSKEKVVISYKRSGAFKITAEVKILDKEIVAKYPWLIIFFFYIIIRRQSDRSAAGAS